MAVLKRVRDFLVRNEKRVVLVLAVLFISAGPVFGGSAVGEVIDKLLMAGTLLANGRILEIF